MAVELDLTDEEATLIWCQGVRARAGWRRALEDGNRNDIVYYSTWMDCVLDRIEKAAPANLKPTGNETQKP